MVVVVVVVAAAVSFPSLAARKMQREGVGGMEVGGGAMRREAAGGIER